MRSQIDSHIVISEPKLVFHPERHGDQEIHPLRGLLRFGPYSGNTVPTPIRIGTLAPSHESRLLYGLMKELKSVQEPREHKDYLPRWPGFHRVFGLHVSPASINCRIELSPSIDDEMSGSSTPHKILADRLVRAIQRLDSVKAEFDVLFIYLPHRWQHGYAGGIGDDFDLHDHLKATTALRGFPIQIVREDSALSYRCRASVMWRLGLALYVKSGGVPWKLADSDPDTAYIGISYAIRQSQDERKQFITCCSQVFDADGSGLEFVAYDAHEQEVEIIRDNPYLSRTEMFRVMSRSMTLYRRRHAGRSPRRVMVHKTTEFKQDEVRGCMDAFHVCEAIDLVQVVEDVGWRGVRLDAPRSGSSKGIAARFPVSRGTLIGIGPYEALLWTHGNVSNIAKAGSYFKGSRSTPRPIKLVRHVGHGSWHDTTQSILGLSKMNWNNDSLYDTLPVTMAYAKILARVVKRIPNLRSAPYQIRFFM